MEFKNRLKKARKAAKLTQPQLAEKVKELGGKLSQQMISMIENGDRYETTAILELSKACGVRPEWLKSEDGDMLPHTYEYTPTGGVRFGGSPDIKHIPIENTEDNNELNPELRKAINYLSTPPPGMNELAESIVQMINKLPTKNLNHLIKNKKPDNIKKGGNS